MRFEAPSHKICVIVVLIFEFVNLSLALKCWQCSSRSTVSELQQSQSRQAKFISECGDPFSNSSAILDDCEARGSALHQSWCRKTIQKSNNIVIFTRSCDLNHEELNEYELGNRNGRQRTFVEEQHRCSSRSEKNGDFMDDCWCRGRDGCNAFATDLREALKISSSCRLNPVSMSFILGFLMFATVF